MISCNYDSLEYEAKVSQYLKKKRMKKSTLAEKIGVDKKTLYNKLKNIEMMRIGEAQLIQRVLSIPPEEWAF